MLRTSRGVLDLLSSSLVGTRKTQPYALTVETQTFQHHGRNSTSTACLHGPSRQPTRPVLIRQPTGLVSSKLPTRLVHSRDPGRVFQSTQILSPSLPVMTSFTLQPHFLSGVYYDNCDCHILCTRA